MLLAAALLACSTPTPPAPPPEPPTPSPEQLGEQALKPKGELPWKRPPFQARMHEQFAFATDATWHVIRGDLEQVRAQGAGLLALEAPPDLPSGWRPAWEEMRAAAKKAAEAQDLKAASVAVVELGAACAGCHTAHPGPQASVEEVLGGGWSTPDAMQRHNWAAYVMWVGLVLPSDTVFVAGAEQLGHDTSLPAAAAGREGQEAETHDLARQAAGARDEAGRNAAFAGMLERCAACHQAAGITIQ